MGKVTEKQEKFLKNLIYKGMSQREAYRDAYQNQKMKDKSIDECASRLMKNIKVVSRYEELKAEKEGIEFFGLSKSEERFVEELILGKSQRESYKNAFNCKNFKDKTVDEKASRLFNTDKIQARYKQLKNKILQEAEKGTIMEGKEILQELTSIARSSLADVLEVKVTNHGVKVGVKEDFDLKNVKEFYLDAQGNIRVKMHDPVKAMDKLANLQNVKEEHEAENRRKANEIQVVMKIDEEESV